MSSFTLLPARLRRLFRLRGGFAIWARRVRAIVPAALAAPLSGFLRSSSKTKGQDDLARLCEEPVVPQGRIRRLTPDDKELFREHLLRLDTETRRNRFAMHATDRFLTTYSDTAFSLATTIFAFEVDGRICGTGELRRLPDRDDGTAADKAEAAFCVESTWRQNGIGTRLMELVLLDAEATGVRHMYINCLASNRKMQALARKFDANLTFEQGDVIGLLKPHRQTVLKARAMAPRPIEAGAA